MTNMCVEFNSAIRKIGKKRILAELHMKIKFSQVEPVMCNIRVPK